MNSKHNIQAGDVWRLGKHKLACGDSTQLISYQKLLGNEKVSLTITDPPYNVAYKRFVNGDNQGNAFTNFLKIVCQHIVDHTSGAIYISMASSEMYALKKAFEDAGGHWSTFIIWAKNHFTISRADYHKQFEPILYGWSKNGNKYWCGDRTQSDLWAIKRVGSNKLHPTMKPVELMERMIENSCQSDDLVLDPFGGSGTTLISCENKGRQCRMIEIDPHYCQIIVDRWEHHTGKQAFKIGESEWQK